MPNFFRLFSVSQREHREPLLAKFPGLLFSPHHSSDELTLELEDLGHELAGLRAAKQVIEDRHGVNPITDPSVLLAYAELVGQVAQRESKAAALSKQLGFIPLVDKGQTVSEAKSRSLVELIKPTTTNRKVSA